jgi:hypothetical protein
VVKKGDEAIGDGAADAVKGWCMVSGMGEWGNCLCLEWLFVL